MSLLQPQLRKLLRFLSLPPQKIDIQLKRDIREAGRKGGAGGDFHQPFWRSVKDCAGNLDNLQALVQINIEKNDRRRRLYPMLRDSFLIWARDKRRLTNLPVTLLDQSIYGKTQIGSLPNEVAVTNLLSIDLGGQEKRHIYPYFDEKSALNADIARLGLWCMSQALPDIPVDELRLLDVLRSRSYSVAELPFNGNEEMQLEKEFDALLVRRKQLADKADDK